MLEFGLADVVLPIAYVAGALGGWFLYWRENQYRRDVLTDLLVLVREYDVSREELRRSLEWDEVEERLERWDDV